MSRCIPLVIRCAVVPRIYASLVALVSLTMSSLACAGTPPSDSGYITLRDGTQLAYSLWLPAGPGPFPVILDYDPYVGGSASNIHSNLGWDTAGYALLGVNVRGTGCSSGTFEAVNGGSIGQDGAQIVDWAARQLWSNGRIGMIGSSYGAETQIATAAFSGSALKAITPFANGSDLYRDMIYPGGIYDAAWINLWANAGQPNLSADAANAADPVCVANRAQSAQTNPAANVATVAPQHPYLDSYYSAQPSSYLSRVHLPVLGCTTWQDLILSSREVSVYATQLDPALTWFFGSNGMHTACTLPSGVLIQFLDHFVKGVENGFEVTPHVQLAHEVSAQNVQLQSPAGNMSGAPVWTSSLTNWDGSVSPLTLYLKGDGSLTLTVPDDTSSSASYTYPAASANTYYTWTAKAAQGTTLSYTTSTLASDIEFLGPASLDLWMSSTATDADVQVTLSEVRPDGQEMYVQQGWLRLSHRALDTFRSTQLRPFHTHLEQDAALLVAGMPVQVRIEIQPFNHVFRAGSAIRVGIDTPSQLAYLTTPATNTIYTDVNHVSQMVLGRVSSSQATATWPACDSTAGQPCRANAIAVPAGQLVPPEPKTITTKAPTAPTAGGGAMGGVSLVTLLLARILRGVATRRRGRSRV